MKIEIKIPEGVPKDKRGQLCDYIIDDLKRALKKGYSTSGEFKFATIVEESD